MKNPSFDSTKTGGKQIEAQGSERGSAAVTCASICFPAVLVRIE